MAGTIAQSIIDHRTRGVVRTEVELTGNAAGTCDAATVGVAFGRLVGVYVKQATGGALPVITVSDGKSGASRFTYDFATPNVFGDTTTGDEAGGASADLFTAGASHGLTADDPIVFLTQVGSTLPAVGTLYYADVVDATTFHVLDAPSGDTVELDGDVSESTWYNLNTAVATVAKRPSEVVVSVAGATLGSASANYPNTNRDIYFGGKVNIGATGLVGADTCTVVLIIDESGVGDLALTV